MPREPFDMESYYTNQNPGMKFTRREMQERASVLTEKAAGRNTVGYQAIGASAEGTMTGGRKNVDGSVIGNMETTRAMKWEAIAGPGAAEAAQGIRVGGGGTIGGAPSLKGAKQAGTFGSDGGQSLLADPGRRKGFIEIGKSFGFTVGEKKVPLIGAKEDTTFVKPGEAAVKRWSSTDPVKKDEVSGVALAAGGGETRSLNGQLDDFVFEGSMSDKDRQTVMKALLRKHGPRGVLS